MGFDIHVRSADLSSSVFKMAIVHFVSMHEGANTRARIIMSMLFRKYQLALIHVVARNCNLLRYTATDGDCKICNPDEPVAWIRHRF